MTPGVALLRRPATALLRRPAARRAAARLAARRGRSLALVYHRVGPRVPVHAQAWPTVPEALFRRHMQTLAAMGEVVPLEDLVRRVGTPGLRFAVTFDDDSASHAGVVLPILRELGIPATFFLSGRCLAGAGTYWWERLERAAVVGGVAALRAQFGLSGRTVYELAREIEGTPLARCVEESLPDVPGADLDEAAIRDLREAGMAIGFHTLQHPMLPRVAAAEAEAALRDGRSALEALVGDRLRYFAYPHGRTNAAIASLVERGRFDAAWTTTPCPVERSASRFELGRWDAGPLAPRAFAAALAIRVNRPW